jgi:hypothetical protein
VLTPDGTVKFWEEPVFVNVHVTVVPDSEQFDGNADDGVAGPTTQSPATSSPAAPTAGHRPRRPSPAPFLTSPASPG